jgi:Restriction endonuclease
MMAKVTRTFGPIHFEDLDPHRFEDLIRELTYDYKDWQSIEATGRSGADAGFDIRAYERVSTGQTVATDPEDAEEPHPMAGNRWMIQCKREKEIGPKKLLTILDDVDESDPPYGYILAAATNFSKQSYDVFRTKLIQKGVMEFYLWGKAELEDMLHQPKNDRILFTFFGISLVTRRRSRSTEIRFAVNNKNKLFRVLGEQIGHSPVLFRDADDEHYPYKGNYKDFEKYPRWKEFEATEYHAHGLVAKIAERFAYIDRDKKEFDYTEHASLIFRQSVSHEEQQEQHEARQIVEDYWDHLPNRHKAHYVENGLVRFDEMLVVDDKGIEPHKFPHIFVEFKSDNGPFAGFFRYLEVSRGYGEPQTFDIRDWKRVKKFPATFPEPSVGTIHQEGAV